MKQDLAIATLSLIRTDEERQVVLHTIEELDNLNVPVVIVDGGSKTEDINKIKSYKNVVLFEEKGLQNQLLRSQKEARNLANNIFYLHTDKLEFVKENAKSLIAQYLSQNPKGMFVPTRNTESINSYPSYQQKAEKFLNFFISDYIGINNDFYSGPKLYPALLVNYLDKLYEDIGWGIEAYYYVLAKRLGLPFYFQTVFSPSPNDIDDQEKTKEYRLKIVEWQIKGFLFGKEVKL